MNDYDSIVNDYVEAPASQAATSINANPDQAVRARQLSRATNQPVLAVYNDLDNAEQEHRAALTRNIVSGNDKLAAYIRGNDLADVVSNDDYGNLDNIGRASKNVLDHGSDTGLKAWVPGPKDVFGPAIDATRNYISTALREGTKGAFQSLIEGFGYDFSKGDFNFYMDEALNKYSPGFTERNPYSAEAYRALELIPRTIVGTTMSPINAAAGFLGGAGTSMASQLGADSSANQLKRELPEVVMQGVMGQSAPHVAEGAGNIIRAVEATRAAKPWLDAGVDVPRGVHPLIDQIKEKTNDAWVDKIQNVLQEAQTSFTKERDPELFKSYMKEYFADAQMGISADAVVRLYGDKLPSREDGILGWIPGIEDKLEAAKTFGEDVHVPLADWVTYVDPQLASELKPDLRAWPGGITKNEAAVKDIAAPAIDGALPQVRTSAALEPMFAIGDRPLKLEKGESIWKGMEDYNFVDHTGKVVGEITIFPDPMKKQLYIASVSSHDLQPNTMGPSLIRDIKRQLKELYPEYETISGYRISGAREEAGAPKEQRKPVVKLALGDAFELSREYTDLRRILETAPTKFGDVTADLVPKELWTKNEHAINQAMQEEVNRIAGKTVEPILAGDIRYEGIDGIRGVYHQTPGEVAKILVAALDPDKIGILRHELIHHLYRKGFFKPEEWNALIEASKKEGWIDRYGIAGRYGHLNELGQHEEAIAEAFRDWAKTREQQPVTPVTTIFQKLWDLMQRIKDRVAKILGREPRFDELFEAAYSGELAQREAGAKTSGDMFAKGGKEPPPVEEGKIRYYHGTAFENAKDFEGKTFLTPQYEYARDYRGGPNNVFYTDFTREEAIQRGLYDETNGFARIGSIDDGAARLLPHTIKESTEAKTKSTPKQKEELQTQLKAEAAGLDAKHKKKIDKLINQEYKENLEAAMKRAEAEQKTLQSKEWKEAAKEIRKEVEADIKQRPDVAADLLIGSGELGGKQLERKNYPLRAEDLTEAQKASLPRRYYSKDGIPVDIMANLFGFTSGDRLIEDLSSYTKSREGMSAQEGLRKTIDEEVQRRMEEKFGKLQDNIMLEAMDQAFSETALNRLAEEWQGAAMQAGIQVIDKNVAKEEALRIFNKRTLKEINPEHLIGIMGKLGRDAERAAIDQRWNDMSVLMQRKYMTGLIVAEARKLQKEQLIFDRTIRPYRKQFDPSKSMNIDPEWGLFIRDFLGKIDRPNGMTRLGLEQRIADSRFKDFADFVNKTENENQLMGLEFPIDEKYLDPNYGKPTDQMTAGEFREVRNLVNFMDKMGKTFHQAEVAGKTIQRGDWLAQAREQLSEKFDSVNISKSETKNAVSRFIVASTNIETLFGRFDGRDKHGLFTETFVYPAFRADNFEAAKQKEIAKAYKELGQIENSQRTLPSIFRDPLNNNELLKDVTRANLAVVISNMGNDYTFNRLARGWGIEPEILWDWVKQHSTVADLERAAKMGKIFEGLWKESATMYRSLYTFAPEAVVPRPFEMHGRRWDGWYHPVIGDSHRSRFVNKLPEMEDYGFWPSVSNGYTKRRTGADQVIDLTYEAIPNRMSQMIHDIAFRPFITETVKLIKDNSFRQMITQYYGKDSMQQIDGWFLRLAGEKSYQTDAMRQAIKISNNIRQNVITTQIAFNLGTVQKHGTTAWLMSAREMGPNLFKTVPKFIADTAIIGVDKIAHEIGLDKYRKAVWETFGNSYAVGDSIWDFVHTNFEEIQRRERQIYDTIGGQHQIITDEKTPWREYVSHYGAKLVSFSDKMSAVPLAWAKYQELRGMGVSHGASVDIASAAVRRAHGSVGRANLPGIVTSVNPVTPWLTSIYGFMGTSMQRRIEIFHDINDAFKLGREGEIREAANKIPAILSSIAVYIVWTGFIEETVSSQFTDDRRGLGEKTLSHLFGWTSNAILGMRDLYHNIEYGKESAGLIGTPIHDVLNFGHDIKKAIHNGRIERGEGSKMLQHGLTAIGDLYGVAPKHLAAPIRYGIDVFSGYQKPKSTGDIYRGLMTGKQELNIRR